MSGRFARKRDENESEIVRAFEVRGAHVAKIEGAGVPDLLVSYRDELILVEVKDIKPGAKRAQKGKHDDAEYRELTPAQVKWWRGWRGKPPVVVHNVAEVHALLARMEAEFTAGLEATLKTLPQPQV